MLPTYRFKFDKLVRDKIPKILHQLDARVHTRTLNTEEYKRRLQEKLIEEVTELQTAGASQNERREELADSLEVLIALGQAYGLEFEDILYKSGTKRDKNGGFDARLC